MKIDKNNTFSTQKSKNAASLNKKDVQEVFSEKLIEPEQKFLKYPVWQKIKELFHRRHLLYFLIQKEIKVKYKHSTLGFLWALIYPLAQAIIFFLVFSLVMKIKLAHYPIYLLSGLIPWTFFSFSFGSSTYCIEENASLIKKIYFPREIIPLSKVFNYLTDFFLALIILFAIQFVMGIKLNSSVFYLPITILIHFTFTSGVCFLASSLAVVYRDTKYFVDLLNLFWFYVSPIIYPVSLIPDKYKILIPVYFLNPMAGIMHLYHCAIYYQKPPSFLILSYTSIFSIFVFWLGLRVFQKYERLFADKV